MKKHGRVVVITGASSGIGRATALMFAENGDNVVVAARRKNLLNDVAEECRQQGVEALVVECDVTEQDSVERIAKAANRKFGRFDVWVNDAGIGAVGKFDEIRPEEHHRVIETNLNGVIYGSHVALRHFRDRREGVLINISSVLGKVTQPYMSSYSASKHGVRALSACIRQELWLDGEKNIHVCTVFPESVDTPFFKHEANRSGYQIKPAPPIVNPEQVAQVIYRLSNEPRDEAHVGKMGKWMGIQQQIARKATEKQMAVLMDRKHFDRSRRERGHSGILWKAARSEDGEIHGGWKNGSSRWKRPASVIGMAAPAALGVFLVLKKRRSSQLREAA